MIVTLVLPYWLTSVQQLREWVRFSMTDSLNPLTVSSVSIRAYGAEKSFKAESLKRIDHLMKIARSQFNLNRWISIRIDLLGAMFTSALAGYLIANKTQSAANIGFSLNMALEFTQMILWLVRWYNDFEVQANRFVYV